MTGQPSPPDLLRRFTPTPYVFELHVGRELIRIEADDLQIALSVRHACREQCRDGGGPVVFWRLIQDRCAPRYGEELSVFSLEKVKTLLHGSGTLLVADVERREVFGFIGAGLRLTQLTERLLPMLTQSDAE
jgi:hypothetical protein